jgi:hypothetical protein
VVDVLCRAGFRQVADEAVSGLPDPVDFDDVSVFLQQRGIFFDDLISQRGGSP